MRTIKTYGFFVIRFSRTILNFGVSFPIGNAGLKSVEPGVLQKIMA